jgi:hypothetical protein
VSNHLPFKAILCLCVPNNYLTVLWGFLVVYRNCDLSLVYISGQGANICDFELFYLLFYKFKQLFHLIPLIWLYCIYSRAYEDISFILSENNAILKVKAHRTQLGTLKF